MPTAPESATAVAVVVGASREQAADVFGEYFEHAFLTSYDDFDDEVDLDLLGSVGLVADGRLPEVLPRLLARDNTDRATPLRVVLGLPPGQSQRLSPETVLADCPGLRVGRVLESGDNVLWLLEGEGSPTGPAPDDVDPLLPRHRQPVAPARPGATPGAEVAPAATRGWSHQVDRIGRRRFLRWSLVALVALVVTAVVLTVVGLSDAGADGVVVAVVLVVLAGQAALLVGLAHVVRLVGETRTGANDEDTRLFRKQLRRRTHRLLRLAREGAAQQETRAVELTDSLSRELAVTRERLTAVTRLLARTGVASREQAAEQLAQHEATRRHLDAALSAAGRGPSDSAGPVEAVSPGSGFLLACVEALAQQRPASIMTCGAGQSAAFLTLAAAQLGVPARVVSLEPDRTSAQALEELLAGLGLRAHADVRVGWYGEAVLAGVSGIELLVVQALPGSSERRGRPALPLPRDLLADRCTIVIDPRLSSTDTETAFGWASLLPGFVLADSADSGHVTLLRRGFGSA